ARPSWTSGARTGGRWLAPRWPSRTPSSCGSVAAHPRTALSPTTAAAAPCLPVREHAVAFTCSGQRERYLRETLESWRQVRGIDEWSLVFSFEPCEQVFPIGAFYEWVTNAFSDAHVLVNRTRQGCARNTHQAMVSAFSQGAQFTVLAEEDIQVSTDVLEYFTWAAGKYEGAGLATVCSHVKASDGGRPDQVTRASWFSPLVWGTWAHTWREFVAPTWG